MTEERFQEWYSSQPYASCDGCDEDTAVCDLQRVPRAIITTHIHPPIPIRCYDWQATFENYEPGDLVGYGATEEEAVADLKEQAEDGGVRLLCWECIDKQEDDDER